MKYTPETLLQIFIGGSLTPDAQVEFDRLMKDSPEFAEKVTQAMTENMGPVPSAVVDPISDRLDAKFESLWVKNKPSRFARYFRIASKIGLALGVVGLAIYLFSILWPKLLSAFPQIDLAGTKSIPISVPKSELAPPAIIAPISPKSTTPSLPALVKPAVPAKPKAVTTAPPVPTIPPMVKPNYNVQTGNSIRLVVDNDKQQDVDITVLSPAGILVRHLYQGSWVAGSHFVDWDGKDDSGASVSAGNYTIVVKTPTKTQSGVVTIQPNR